MLSENLTARQTRAKKIASEQIANDTAEYLKSGKKIKQLKTGFVTNIDVRLNTEIQHCPASIQLRHMALKTLEWLDCLVYSKRNRGFFLKRSKDHEQVFLGKTLGEAKQAIWKIAEDQ